MMSTGVFIVACLATICLAQGAAQTTEAPSLIPSTSSKSTLQSLEALGISFLSSILLPATTSSTSTSSPPSAFSTSTASISTIKALQSPTSTRFDQSYSSTSTPTPTAAAAVSTPSHSNRNTIIILATLLSLLVVGLIVAGFWVCFRRRRHGSWGRRGSTPIDDREILSWKSPKVEQNAAVEEVPKEPQVVVAPVKPYTGHQSRQHFSGRDPFADSGRRASQDIAAPVVTQTPLSPSNERNNSGTHIIPRKDVAAVPRKDIGTVTKKPSNWDLVVENNYRSFRPDKNGYAPLPMPQPRRFKPNDSVTSLPERVPTPMFGTGREKGEAPDSAPQQQKRNSAVPTPTGIGSWGPRSNANDIGGSSINRSTPWVPQRHPRRPRSMSSSPLVPTQQDERAPLRGNQFDFGFDQHQPPTRYSGAGMHLSDAHHRF